MGILFIRSMTLFFLSFVSFAVCIPTNQYNSLFLGFSPDSSQFATGHFDQVIMWGAKDKKDSITTQLCVHSTKMDSEIKCEKLDLRVNGDQSFDKEMKKYFKKKYPEWNYEKDQYIPNIASIMDCRGTKEEAPKCIIEISEYVGNMERKILFKSFHKLSSHEDATPRIRDDANIFSSKDKKAVCYQYKIPHESANCGSYEEPTYCINL